jgi:hypothetical protein
MEPRRKLFGHDIWDTAVRLMEEHSACFATRAEEVISFASRQNTLQYGHHSHLLTEGVKGRFRKAVARIPTENIGS